MDALAFRMYFLAMSSDEELAGIVSFSSPSTPIGRVRFGGHLQGVGGTGFSHFRTYGMYALVLLTGNGAGRFRDQRGNNRRVRAGDLIVVFPDVPHQYGPEGGDVWEEIFIAFDGAAFEGWRSRGLDPALPVWPVDPVDDWARRFSGILTLPVATRPEACAAASAVHLLIADALAVRPPDTASRDWLEPAKQALGRGAGAPTLPEIATQAGLGYETFRKSFKTITGESPARYRRRMRLAQAELMLHRADLSLEMIARALDFCDAFHLSKAFKAQYGHSPAALRRPPGGARPG
jgi:AraC-like DNA-binding protein